MEKHTYTYFQDSDWTFFLLDRMKISLISNICTICDPDFGTVFGMLMIGREPTSDHIITKRSFYQTLDTSIILDYVQEVLTHSIW